MGSCCFCACIFKTILGLLNMVLMVAGILVAGVGGAFYGMAESSAVKEFIRIIVVPIIEYQFGKNYIIGSVSGDFRELITPVAWFLIIMGCIIGAIAIIGYLGLNLSINAFLIAYAALIGTIIVVQIVISILFYTGGLTGPTNNLVKKILVKHYKGLEDLDDGNGTNVYALTWNVIMMKLNCCGASNYMDFQDNLEVTNKWPRNKTFSIKVQNDENFENLTFLGTKQMPLACCKNMAEFPKMYYNDTKCMADNSTNNNNNLGCTEAIMNEIKKSKSESLTIFLFALFLQIILLIMVIVIIQENKNNKRNNNENNSNDDEADARCIGISARLAPPLKKEPKSARFLAMSAASTRKNNITDSETGFVAIFNLPS
ncbi:hypothetical protein HELRODRAFT_190223 [Helobdella robusta]|uniref:Tetraspanin n=1 Tax=Helobdella robusta TaxID=6412 RepID=T1FRS4_HELRO|nr:hypothetical protein HELRODRAFT_190223 [Helobdella robusta]ESO10892.1 hypothetical protein HELRODRAFT_190223 [Helobdella robusta]